MKHLTKYLIENPKFIKDFKFWLLRDKKKSSVKTYDGQFITKYSCWEGTLKMERTIIFYEWSNVTGTKRYFNLLKDFYEFLEESKIAYPDYNMRSEIEKCDVSHMTCVPGEAKLIHASSKEGLKKALDEINKKKAEIKK